MPTIHKITLLKGGWNSERAVSLESAKGISKALKNLGYEVSEIDVTQDIPWLIQEICRTQPDVVFLNALHGQYLEDGMMQGLMELLGIPYTGSNVVASAMAMDKNVTREMLIHHHLPVPKGRKVDIASFFAQKEHDPYPFVLKPLNEGSSVGVYIVKSREDFHVAQNSWHYGDEGLVEEFIAGQEISVALLNDCPLGVIELEPIEGFYDYQAKYTTGKTRHYMPARIDQNDYKDIMDMSAKAVRALGVQGASRVDLRYDATRPQGQRTFILEVNTLPGMTGLSIVPEIAAFAGYSYEQLCEWMIKHPIWPRKNQCLKEKYW